MTRTNKKTINKKIESDSDDPESDSGSVYSSESDYDSDNLSGGSDENNDSDDNVTLTVDTDDEKDEDDEKYDPINDAEEEEDPEDVEEAVEEDEEDERGLDELEDVEDGEMGSYSAKSKKCSIKNLDNNIIFDEDDSETYGKMVYKEVHYTERITGKYMTDYEMIGLIGIRAQQFCTGATPMIKGIDHLHPAKIAYVELVTLMTPLSVKRYLPGKLYEIWHVDELILPKEITDEYYVPKNIDWKKIKKQADAALIKIRAHRQKIRDQKDKKK